MLDQELGAEGCCLLGRLQSRSRSREFTHESGCLRLSRLDVGELGFSGALEGNLHSKAKLEGGESSAVEATVEQSESESRTE